MTDTTKPKQIRAIDLVKQVFEHIYGNLTLLRFNIEKLTPINGIEGNPDANKWDVIVNFYQNLTSQKPTEYKIEVNLVDNTVSFYSVDDSGLPKDKKQTYKVIKENESDIAKNSPK